MPAAPRDRDRKTILVVEDTEELRRMICQILAHHGYTVLEAANGVEALEVCGAYPSPIHLVLTDLVMPRMNGGELAAHLRRMHPRMPMLFMSGYAEDPVARSLERLTFLAKPFTSGTLMQKIREVLDDGTLSPEANRAG